MRLSLLILLSVLMHFTHGQFTATQNGNWASGATWGNAGNTLGIDYPDHLDEVNIPTGVTVTISNNNDNGNSANIDNISDDICGVSGSSEDCVAFPCSANAFYHLGNINLAGTLSPGFGVNLVFGADLMITSGGVFNGFGRSLVIHNAQFDVMSGASLYITRILVSGTGIFNVHSGAVVQMVNDLFLEGSNSYWCGDGEVDMISGLGNLTACPVNDGIVLDQICAELTIDCTFGDSDCCNDSSHSCTAALESLAGSFPGDGILVPFEDDGVTERPFLHVVLPVEYLFFFAEYQDHQVTVSWATATEKVNSHFEVERSLDGEDYTVIATLEGAGDSQERIDYQYTDREIPVINSSEIYYRLRQVDYDGQFEYSRTIVAIREDFVPYEVILRPNPFHGYLLINLESTEAEESQVLLFDSKGTLHHVSSYPISEGMNEIEINGLEGLMPGIYFLVIRTSSMYVKRKLIRQ